MKWLLFYAAVHGLLSSDQCRVLRQVRLAVPECTSHFASARVAAAALAGRTPSQGSPPSASRGPAGPSGPATGGSSPAGSPGSPSGGSPPSGASSPGNPSGGASPPGGALGGSPIEPPPTKPSIDAATLAKLRSELRDRLVDRIIFGAPKPPDRPGRPSFGDKPGLGMTLGPGGLRGASSTPTNSGGIRR